METLNIELFQWVNHQAGTNYLLDRTALFFAVGGPYLMIAFFVFLWLRVDMQGREVLLLAIEASLIGLLANLLIALVYFHPRPFMMGIGHPLLAHSPDTSFPSDHATLLFSASFYLLIFGGWTAAGMFLTIIAFLTAWARVYAGVHFPMDMAGSLAVSLISAMIVYRARAPLKGINEPLIGLYERIVRRLLSLF